MPATKNSIHNEPKEPRSRSVAPVPTRFPRPSHVIEAQLADFLATLPSGIQEPPSDDFAAKLQWDSWQNHRKELEAELDQALEAESNRQLKAGVSDNAGASPASAKNGGESPSGGDEAIPEERI